MRLNPYYGDIHNHCGISYGNGSIEDAFANARLQLDFASVTGHSSWPDMPVDDKRLKAVVDYHRRGFSKLGRSWARFLEVTEGNNEPGRFVTFLSYEWHSMRFGDYVFMTREARESQLKPRTLGEWREIILEERGRGLGSLLIPHHIGYKRGYRGINWDTYLEEISPVVEIISMHGCSESDDAPRPNLHTMGPRDSGSTMQAGLARGYHFGVLGSTDHHSAHPGSFGYGLTGLWAPALTREAVWEAIAQRRTWALTGDHIELSFSINGHLLGSRLPFSRARRIEIGVRGGYSLDHVDLIKNNETLRRWDFTGSAGRLSAGGVRGKVFIELGWGEKGRSCEWDASIQIANGRLLGVEPRFRGIDTVDPQDVQRNHYRLTEWKEGRANSVSFKTMTRGNPTVMTNTNQGVSLEIEGTGDTRIELLVNGVNLHTHLKDLAAGSRANYLGGFLSGAVHIHRFVPEAEYSTNLDFEDRPSARGSDFYYLRVAQRNDQWAWSSPIRFSAPED